MKRTLIALTLAGFGFAAPAIAGPLEEQFFAMDTSRDGNISRSEFVAFQKEQGATERQANFAFDNTAGDDGRISLAEYRAGPVARTQQRSLTRRSSQRQRSQPTRRPASGGGSFGGGGGGT